MVADRPVIAVLAAYTRPPIRRVEPCLLIHAAIHEQVMEACDLIRELDAEEAMFYRLHAEHRRAS